jgi:hypothetical protein
MLVEGVLDRASIVTHFAKSRLRAWVYESGPPGASAAGRELPQFWHR